MRIEIDNGLVTVYEGNALQTLQALEPDSVDCVVTSPPYWGLRDYGHTDQIGLEPSPFEYIEKLATVFDEVKRVLKPSGTCWVVIGDSYAGSGKGNGGSSDASRKQTTNPGSYHGGLVTHYKGSSIKAKDLCGIPWRLAFALQDRGWYLRQDIIWAKPNPMPESVTDRCTRSHEYIFLLTKSARYFYDQKAIAEAASWERWGDQTENKKHVGTAGHLGGKRIDELPIQDSKNRRDVWSIATEGFSEAHFATFPTVLVEMCIKAGCPPDGVVMDPFSGCGTTLEVALKLGRRAIGVELNPEYVEMIRKNLGLFAVAQ